jgi:D-alanine-D-alanine ligase
MARVGLIFGGRSVEHKVSVSSARTVAAALEEAGHEVVPLGVAADGCWLEPAAAARALAGEVDALAPLGRRVAGTLRVLVEAAVDVLFPIVHGTWGEDGSLQGLCEMFDVAYAGAGVTASALAMDKAFAKQLLAARALPVVDYEVVGKGELERAPAAVLARLGRFTPPIFVKPSVGGSSVGVSRVPSLACLETAVRLALRFDDRVVVERGIAGRELECAVLGHHTLEASAIGEIVPGREFYDYADKYLADEARLIAPAELPEELARRLRELAVDAFAALGGWGMARVDFLLEGDDLVWINEINTLPGFTRISMYPRLWELSGVPLPALVDRLVAIARERHGERRRLDDGIKEWIAEISGE